MRKDKTAVIKHDSFFGLDVRIRVMDSYLGLRMIYPSFLGLGRGTNPLTLVKHSDSTLIINCITRQGCLEVPFVLSCDCRPRPLLFP